MTKTEDIMLLFRGMVHTPLTIIHPPIESPYSFPQVIIQFRDEQGCFQEIAGMWQGTPRKRRSATPGRTHDVIQCHLKVRNTASLHIFQQQSFRTYNNTFLAFQNTFLSYMPTGQEP